MAKLVGSMRAAYAQLRRRGSAQWRSLRDVALLWPDQAASGSGKARRHLLPSTTITLTRSSLIIGQPLRSEFAETTSGPNDQTPSMPRYDLQGRGKRCPKVLSHLIKEGSILPHQSISRLIMARWCPCTSLTPAMNLPIVPIFINCVVPPLPTSQAMLCLRARYRSRHP